MNLNNSIVIKSLRIVFSIYLVLTLVLTSLQIFLEYENSKVSLKHELKHVQSSNQLAISQAFWNIDETQLKNILEGIAQIQFVTGVSMVSSDMELNFSNGATGDKPDDIVHAFDIVYNDEFTGSEQIIGHALFISNEEKALDRIKNSLFILIAAAIIKTTLLWLLIFYVFKKALMQPLQRFVRKISRVDFENLDDVCIFTNDKSEDELAKLAHVFNGMLTTLAHQKQTMLDFEEHQRDVIQQQVDLKTYELQLAKVEADNANESRAQFFANMTHELRTPMHGIITLSQFGVNRLHSVTLEKLGKYFQTINDSGEQLLTLINNLLDLSKLEAGKWKIQLSKSSLLSLTETCISEQTALMKKRCLSIEVLPSDCDGLGYFDKDQLHQVITNLLSNAIKFSDEGSTIEILIEDIQLPLGVYKNKMNALQFSIANQGVTLSKEDYDLIFEQFSQSEKTQNIKGGTGLGLTICREIIEQHGGSIGADKNPKTEGVKVFFNLPINEKSRKNNKGSNDE